MKIIPRLAALLILSISALDASAFCMVGPAGAQTQMTAGAGGTTDYTGTASALFSTCPKPEGQVTTDFYAPYFSDMAISNLSQSSGWSGTIEASNDLFHIGGGVIHFSAPLKLVDPGDPTSGYVIQPLNFSFTSAFSGIASPSIVVGTTFSGVSVTTPLTGDNFQGTFYMPGSPEAIVAFPAAVPEPASWSMLAGGLVLLGFLGACRRKR